MDIDITSINNKNVPINFFVNFADQCVLNHIALVRNKDYRRIAFSSSNKNNFKKFFEEVLPLKYFLENVRSLYQHVKYMSGDQCGDALLDDLKTIEITKAQNPKRFLVTQDMLEFGYAYSPRKLGISSSDSLPTRTRPYVYTNFEYVEDLLGYIQLAVDKKGNDKYPSDTILIVLFQSDVLLVDQDYEELGISLKKLNKGHFSQIYLIENLLKDDLKPKWEMLV